MRIALGCDHGGRELKNRILDYLNELEDRGVIEKVFDLSDDAPLSVDFPVYAAKVVKAVVKKDADRGILVCGTGIGMSMTANRHPQIRCALCNDIFTAMMSRKHNNANILAMGGRVVGGDLGLEIVKVWLETDFITQPDRYQRRNDMINQVMDELDE